MACFTYLGSSHIIDENANVNIVDFIIDFIVHLIRKLWEIHNDNDKLCLRINFPKFMTEPLQFLTWTRNQDQLESQL
jgi:hypothetical protein